jgi:hypothetical protein
MTHAIDDYLAGDWNINSFDLDNGKTVTYLSRPSHDGRCPFSVNTLVDYMKNAFPDLIVHAMDWSTHTSVGSSSSPIATRIGTRNGKRVRVYNKDTYTNITDSPVFDHFTGDAFKTNWDILDFISKTLGYPNTIDL